MHEDGLPDLAALLELDVDALREAIGGPWSPAFEVPEDQLGTLGTIFTGLPDPRTPGRPLAVIQVDHADGRVRVGYAVGFPLVTGDYRWSLAEPRTTLPYDRDEIRVAVFDPEHPLGQTGTIDPDEALLVALRTAIQKVAVAATLKGTQW